MSFKLYLFLGQLKDIEELDFSSIYILFISENENTFTNRFQRLNTTERKSQWTMQVGFLYRFFVRDSFLNGGMNAGRRMNEQVSRVNFPYSIYKIDKQSLCHV